jgi:hypothetical protein
MTLSPGAAYSPKTVEVRDMKYSDVWIILMQLNMERLFRKTSCIYENRRGIRSKIVIYCGMWAVSRKRIGKHVATKRLFVENQPNTKHNFQGYGK